MNQIPEHIESLLVKKFTKTLSESERDSLDAWLAEDSGNGLLFKQLEEAWYQSRQLSLFDKIDLKKNWFSIEQKANVGNRSIPIWRYAAAAILLVVGAVSLYFLMNMEYALIQHTAGKKIEMGLPDGSVVTLNRSASISFVEGFKGDNRVVRLTGEAFFEVKKDPYKPFVVNTHHGSVKVLGTSFNVKTKLSSTSVALQEGKVEYSSSDQKVFLEPGEQILDQDGKVQKSLIPNQNHLGWKTGVYVFENTSLLEVLNELSQDYDFHYQLTKEGMKNCKVSTVFDHTDLKDIKQELEFILGVKISENWEIEGEPCEEQAER